MGMNDGAPNVGARNVAKIIGNLFTIHEKSGKKVARCSLCSGDSQHHAAMSSQRHVPLCPPWPCAPASYAKIIKPTLIIPGNSVHPELQYECPTFLERFVSGVVNIRLY